MRQANSPVEEDEGSFDVGWIGDWLSFVGLAVRRHWVIALLCAVTLGGLGLLAANVMPNRYYVETRLLAPRTDLIAMLTNPGRTLGADSRANSRATLEILRRDNLIAAIRETGLVEQWKATRTPLLKYKDRMAFGRDPTDAELTDALVETLKKRLTAWTAPQDDGSGSLTVGLTWNDPAMTVKLLNAALKGFLDFRQGNELAILGESIAILEERLTDARRELEVALAGARAAVPRNPVRTEIEAPRPARPVATPDPRLLADIVQLRSSLAVKRRALDDLVGFRQRRIEELQTQLAEQRVVYSDSHPVVANTRRSLEAIAADSPQITQLRREISDLESRYVERGGAAADLTDASAAARSASSVGSTVVVPLDPRLRPTEDLERSRLTAAIARYYGVSDRLEGAKLERDSSLASARYRFVVVQPPLYPRKASNGMVKLALKAGGILGGLLLGLVLAVAAEVRRGRIVQAWQVERRLGLPILAVVPGAARAAVEELRA